MPYTTGGNHPINLSPGKSMRWDKCKHRRELPENAHHDYSYRRKIEFVIRDPKIHRCASDLETAKYNEDIGSRHIV